MLMLSISRLGQVIMDTVRYIPNRKLYCLPAPDGRQQRKVDETLTGYHAQIFSTLPRYYMHCLRVLAATMLIKVFLSEMECAAYQEKYKSCSKYCVARPLGNKAVGRRALVQVLWRKVQEGQDGQWGKATKLTFCQTHCGRASGLAMHLGWG